MYVHTFVSLLKESSIHPVLETLASSPGSPIFSKHSTECFKEAIKCLLPRTHAQGVKYSVVSLLSTKYYSTCASCKRNNCAQEQCMHIMHVLSAHAHDQCFILGKGHLQHNYVLTCRVCALLSSSFANQNLQSPQQVGVPAA